MTSEVQPFRIISLDGGGVRGLLTATWLERLESKLDTPLSKRIDLIAGTSSGALIACAIALDIEARTLVEIFKNEVRDVFPAASSRWWNRIGRIFQQGLSAPRYDEAGLERVLRDVFGDTRMGDLGVDQVLVPTYDTLHRRPVMFKNNKPEHQDLLVWEVCKASASAPTYFPAHVMDIDGSQIPLIDGGVVSSNPTASALAEGVRRRRTRSGKSVILREFVVGSFGAGDTTRPISSEEARSWGRLQWAGPIIDVLLGASSESVDYIARAILQDENYVRLETSLMGADDDLDDASPENIEALSRLATEYLHREGDALLERLAQLL